MSFVETLDGAYTWQAMTQGRAAVPAYLIGQYGHAFSPDTPGMALQNVATIVFKIQGPISSSPITLHTIASQWDPFLGGWTLRRSKDDGSLDFNILIDSDSVAFQAVTPNADEYGALTVTQNNGAGQHQLTSWTSADGINWTQVATVTNAPTWSIADIPTPLEIGTYAGGSDPFHGRIYSVEYRVRDHPTARRRVWWFNPNDWPGYGHTWYTENRPWEVTATTAIVQAIPSAPAEVCPSIWEISHAREDIVTQAVLGRDDGGATPERTYNDLTGQAMYGVETPYSLTDLTCEEDFQLDLLADRLFRTRGKYATPRVGAVTIDASTGDNARDLLTQLSVFQPSRYRCRHVLPRGTIFDTTYFATGVTHRMTSEEWTARISLDLASPWQAEGGRWDQSDFDSATFGE